MFLELLITLPGLFMLIAGIAVVAVLEPFIGIRAALVLAGIVLISADLLYKYRSIREWRSIEFLNPALGGTVIIIPVWIVGLFTVGFAIFARN
jgi:hypothetical protein